MELGSSKVATGQTVGFYEDIFGAFHGFEYSSGTWSVVDDPQGANTYAEGITDNGRIVGYYVDNDHIHYHGFFYLHGVYTTLDDPNAQPGPTFAIGINNAGQIVGYYSDHNGATHGFVYNNGIYTTIDDPLGANGTLATGINNAGQVVGYVLDGNGHNHGFLATLGPNPSPPAGTTADMILRGANNSPPAGLYEVYDIGSNAILAGYSLGQAGTDWGFVTLGGFFGSDTTDMLMGTSTT